MLCNIFPSVQRWVVPRLQTGSKKPHLVQRLYTIHLWTQIKGLQICNVPSNFLTSISSNNYSTLNDYMWQLAGLQYNFPTTKRWPLILKLLKGFKVYRVSFIMHHYKVCSQKLTSAPSSIKVSIKTAVCIVMWRQPAILAPWRGLVAPYRRLISISPGISASASSISFRPKSASSKLAWKQGGGGISQSQTQMNIILR